MPTLEYDEIVRMRISRVCPISTRMIEKQNEILDPAGMTLVGFIEIRKNFDALNKQLLLLRHGFISAPNPHLTLLGLFDGNKKFSQVVEDNFRNAIVEFFNSKAIKKFSIRFDQARPGRAYDIRYNPIPSISNGTVFARACPCDHEIQRFEALSRELIKFLDERIPEPYKTTFRRPYPTVWCKLGHFSQAFEINMETKQIFEEFKNINEKATIRSFHLIRYKNRKLPQDKIRVIEQFPLK